MIAEFEPQTWMRHSLRSASLLHFLLGWILYWTPTGISFLFLGESSNSAILLWQVLGIAMVVGSLGCWIASWSPFQHHLFLASLASVFLALSIVTLQSIASGRLTAWSGWLLVLWGLGWSGLIGFIAWSSIRSAHAHRSAFVEPESDDPLRDLHTNTGETLDSLADLRPQMVVFLRHAGCTFCRQTLADIGSVRGEIESTGCGIVLVHLGKEEDPNSTEVFVKYGVDDLPRISDTTSRLYRQFGLDLGGFTQLFGLRVWMRGLIYGLVNGRGIGSIRGNSFQMPGVFLYHCGVVLGGYRHERASDRPDYVALAQQVQVNPAQIRSDESQSVLT